MPSRMLSPVCALVFAVFVLAHATLQAQQSPTISWDQSQGNAVPVLIGAPSQIDVTAYPGMNYALFASRTTAPTVTPIGTIDIDFNDPEFEIGIDGFNPAHPLFTWGFVDSLGHFEFNFVPYALGAPAGQKIYFQTLSQDPTAAPFNLALSNMVGSEAQPLAPRVDAVSPRQITLNDNITIVGQFFNGSSTSPPVVTMGGTPLLVLSYQDDMIVAAVSSALTASGTVRVQTDVGVSPDLSFNSNHYVSLLGIMTTEASQGTTPMDGSYSLVGQISTPSEVDTWYLSLDAGEELFVEVFNYDTANSAIVPYDPSNWMSVQVNPMVELTMPGVPIDPIISDNDGGPGFTAGIGIVQAARFVAPFAGNYELRVKAAFSVTQGDYLLNTWTRPGSAQETPEIIGIHPNYVAPGDELEIYATGLDFGNPASNVVEFAGPAGTWISAPLTQLSNGHLGVTVPATAETGHLRVTNSSGFVSSFDADDYPSFYLIKNNVGQEGTVFSFASSQQIIGAISVPQEVDNYHVTLQQGQKVAYRAFMFDPTAERIVKGRIFEPALLDPEVHIRKLFTTTDLISDVHSGPSTAAEIGGSLIPPWPVPLNDVYEFSIQSWFYLSSGSYIIDIVID